MDENQHILTHIEYLKTEIAALRSDMGKVRDKLDRQYVTKTEFEARFMPIQKMFYAIISLGAITVCAALFKLVIK